MKYFKLWLALVSLLSSSAIASTHTLYAGQYQEIGSVETTYMGLLLTVEATITEPGWCLVKSHLYVGDTAPESSSPGQFPYSHDLGCSVSDTYMIDVSANDQYVAYHAEAVETAFPIGGDPNFTVGPGSESYFEAAIDGGGSYPAWCIDLAHSISYGTTYTDCELRSILDVDLPWVYLPENLPYVQWIINQDWSELLPGSSWQDIQGALWKLTQPTPPENAAGGINWNEENALAIVDMAMIAVDDFGVGDTQLLVMQCKSGNTLKQTTLIAIGMSIEEFFIAEETAWSAGDSFWYNRKGKQIGWGSYWLEFRETE
ncbi:hypothetical protein [Shewanella nanhaiensis]|uniref:Uncharacterized protein n=1 Tax=Shewanella nanhaiensis TaxID=2864872 RepID=A0ABS7E3K8_9GAMM|nr:hypothetical protein [Shewanella nanhaiensis]MBW8184215.1 hypothetical protein [Shewanella nanhaiensis]